jgi:MATE family multidrug resistance protein
MNRKILQLAIPNITSNITVPPLGMVDMVIVGHMGNKQYIGAVAVGAAIFDLLYWNFSFLRMGTSGFAAQAYGRRNPSEAILILGRSVIVGLAIAITLVALQQPMYKLAAYFIDASEGVEEFSHTYFSILIWGTPATLTLYSLKG